ncbi:MAG TPA: transcription-repair coupling factor [Candidatus Omnitrophota bacterium]|nr:transcription-repair coupling factor [Candidatus Omnitrophota bacterium]HPT39250.1 transcription-repair coupling factor [Candidatus Omnitrophota bacterium]
MLFRSLKLYLNQELDIEVCLATLVEFGYSRQDQVSAEGDFSRRGGVIDIFPVSFQLPIRIELDNAKIISIKAFNPENGQALWQHNIVIILPFKKSSGIKNAAFREEFPLNSFLDLHAGDFVVHSQHGIGKFRGIQKVGSKGVLKDHLVIEYDRNEKLLVPVDAMHLVQKYIAFATRKPKLYRLGNKEWLKVKERARRGVQKLAWELLSLQALRISSTGFKFSADTQWQAEFEKTFPYVETPDQIKATREVKLDMESTKPMDRLLCGDVGYGKTEVAMRAAFKAVMDNKQVAYLVPTTILAEQHYKNFTARLSNFPVNVAMLSRFRTKQQQGEIIKNLNQGSVDIVIGTHRLLSPDVSFKNLGLVIVDEEQRFGVKAKEQLKKIKTTIDVLVLTATPIPRTLYMSLMGAKDFSVINTSPQNRLPIKTIVVEYDTDLLIQAIKRELARRGQVFFLHNRISDLEKIKEKLSRNLPQNVRIAMAHGQMPSKLLEQIMADFISGKVDLLVSTMIIESGIDIPNANTIIVNNAQMFGLSDLHQLRGRVGRFNRAAYAYFMIPKSQGASLEMDARKRLQAIQEHSDLGSGFDIAMEDLEIRGAGNLLGQEQHGFISAVGFDLYCRLLKEAIANFKKAGVFDEKHN